MHGFTIILHTLFESIKEKARKLLEFCFPKKQVGGLLRVQSFLHGLLPQLLLLALLQLFQLQTRGYFNYEQQLVLLYLHFFTIYIICATMIFVFSRKRSHEFILYALKMSLF